MNGSSRDITETDTFSVLLTRSPSPIRVLEPWRIERFVRDYWSVLSGDCRDAAAIGQHLRDTQGRIVRHRKGCHPGSFVVARMMCCSMLPSSIESCTVGKRCY